MKSLISMIKQGPPSLFRSCIHRTTIDHNFRWICCGCNRKVNQELLSRNRVLYGHIHPTSTAVIIVIRYTKRVDVKNGKSQIFFRKNGQVRGVPIVMR